MKVTRQKPARKVPGGIAFGVTIELTHDEANLIFEALPLASENITTAFVEPALIDSLDAMFQDRDKALSEPT